MTSKVKKSDKKEKVNTPKGKAYVDTSNSKVVKGTDKAEVEKDKVVVESNSNLDILADFKELARNSKDVNDFIEKVRAKTDTPKEASDEFYNKYSEGGKLSMHDAAKKLFDEANSSNESKNNNINMENNTKEFHDSILNSLNEAIKNSTMNANQVNKWLSENNLQDVISKIKDEDGRYSVEDIVKYISEEQANKLESEVVSFFDIDESVATEDDVITEDDSDGSDEKESSNAPDSPKVTNEENEISTDDDEFEDDDTVNELTDEVTNEDKYSEVQRLLHLMKLKDNANELMNNFGLTNVEKIKESIDEELSEEELNIVLEDVYKSLEVEIKEELIEDDSINESLRNDLGEKLI